MEGRNGLRDMKFKNLNRLREAGAKMATAIYCCLSYVCSSAMNYIIRHITTTDSITLLTLLSVLFSSRSQGDSAAVGERAREAAGEQGASRFEAPCYASLRIAHPIVS